MKQAGIKSKTAENACLWTVNILDDKNYKHFDFNLPQGGDKVCKFDDIEKFVCCWSKYFQYKFADWVVKKNIALCTIHLFY